MHQTRLQASLTPSLSHWLTALLTHPATTTPVTTAPSAAVSGDADAMLKLSYCRDILASRDARCFARWTVRDLAGAFLCERPLTPDAFDEITRRYSAVTASTSGREQARTTRERERERDRKHRHSPVREQRRGGEREATASRSGGRCASAGSIMNPAAVVPLLMQLVGDPRQYVVGV